MSRYYSSRDSGSGHWGSGLGSGSGGRESNEDEGYLSSDTTTELPARPRAKTTNLFSSSAGVPSSSTASRSPTRTGQIDEGYESCTAPTSHQPTNSGTNLPSSSNEFRGTGYGKCMPKLQNLVERFSNFTWEGLKDRKDAEIVLTVFDEAMDSLAEAGKKLKGRQHLLSRESIEGTSDFELTCVPDRSMSTPSTKASRTWYTGYGVSVPQLAKIAKRFSTRTWDGLKNSEDATIVLSSYESALGSLLAAREKLFDRYEHLLDKEAELRTESARSSQGSQSM